MIEHAAVREHPVSKRNFVVKAVWDDEAKVFCSESDIVGLHIEAATIEEFEKAMHDNALGLILENHIKPSDLVKKRIKDLIPMVFWERPAQSIAAE